MAEQHLTGYSDEAVREMMNTTRSDEIRSLLAVAVDPWSQCRDVDPFTGQPEQHEHGDACPDCTDLPEDRH